jgi:hypothetical protein
MYTVQNNPFLSFLFARMQLLRPAVRVGLIRSFVGHSTSPSTLYKPMKINRAIGLGLVILILQWLATGIWSALERTTVTALDTTTTALEAVELGAYVPKLPSPIPTRPD